MSEIPNIGPMSPRTRKLYEEEYKQGTNLFEKALNQSCRSSYPAQQQQFKEVMEKAMEVLNQTAGQLKRKDLLKQNQKIEEDFQAYRKDPSQKHVQALKHDLEQAKKSFEK